MKCFAGLLPTCGRELSLPMRGYEPFVLEMRNAPFRVISPHEGYELTLVIARTAKIIVISPHEGL